MFEIFTFWSFTHIWSATLIRSFQFHIIIIHIRSSSFDTYQYILLPMDRWPSGVIIPANGRWVHSSCCYKASCSLQHRTRWPIGHYYATVLCVSHRTACGRSYCVLSDNESVTGHSFLHHSPTTRLQYFVITKHTSCLPSPLTTLLAWFNR